MSTLTGTPPRTGRQAIAHDLPHCIDERFRTIHNRFGRALVGLSAGGYGAFNIGLRNLSMFAAVESWSGYFVATNPAGYPGPQSRIGQGQRRRHRAHRARA